MARQRPGIPSAKAVVDPQARRVLEALTDVVTRALLASSQVKTISGTVNQNLPAAATLADTITRVNLIATTLNTTIAKLNEVIARMQED